MTGKDDLLQLMLRECRICVHLHGKVPEDGMDFRFTPPQRSTLELLQYLSMIGVAATQVLIDGNFDAYGGFDEEAKTVTAEDFPAAMERQMGRLTEQFAGISDDDFASRETTLPWGETTTLGNAITMLAYGSLVAYRMQLFLQAKSAGNADISTANCWAGVDRPAE